MSKRNRATLRVDIAQHRLNFLLDEENKIPTPKIVCIDWQEFTRGYHARGTRFTPGEAHGLAGVRQAVRTGRLAGDTVPDEVMR